MAIPKMNIRGLKDIRTLAGKVDQSFQPYKAYMKISCIEMEKLRRGKEKESALNRVQNIDTRFQEIEAEKSKLLEAISITATDNAQANPANGPKFAAAHKKGGFKISY